MDVPPDRSDLLDRSVNKLGILVKMHKEKKYKDATQIFKSELLGDIIYNSKYFSL